jgi:hypothetical protein
LQGVSRSILIYNGKVKRTVLIFLVLGLFILSEALTLLATNAGGLSNVELKGSVNKKGLSNVELKGVINKEGPTKFNLTDLGIQVWGTDFYYRLDEKARFIELKNQWQSEHRGELPIEQARIFSEMAYDQSSVDEVLRLWRHQGGPSPWVFSAKAHIFNNSDTAYLNVPVHITYRAKVGELRVNSATQLTDFKHLSQSVQWNSFPGSHQISIAAIAPGEDMLLDLGRVNLLAFLVSNPKQWPAEIEVSISSPQFKTVRQVLKLTPDHFLTPYMY